MFSPSSQSPPLKIGLIRSSSIGDVVLATSCISLLKQLSMPMDITWIGRQPSIELLRHSFPELRYLEMEDGIASKSFLQNLEGLHFLVDLQGNLRSNLLLLAFQKMWRRPVFRIEKRSLFRRNLVWSARLRGRKKPLPPEVQKPGILQYQSMADTLFKALRSCLPPELRYDLSKIKPVPQLPDPGPDTLKSWQKELNFGCWLALAPGASYLTKRAPEDVWVRIIAGIRDRYYQLRGSSELPPGLLILGDQHDRQFSLRLLDQLGWNDPVLNMAGTLTLWESAQALRGRACLLSNDSSLAHIAEAVGTPTAVLFGPTVEGFGFTPRMDISRAFSIPLGCRPCSRHGQTPCRFSDQLCFSGLPVEEISGYVVRLLAGKINKPEGSFTMAEPTEQTGEQTR